MSILSIGYVFYLVQRGVAVPVLMGMSKLKVPTLMMIVAALVNLVLSVFPGHLGASQALLGVQPSLL